MHHIISSGEEEDKKQEDDMEEESKELRDFLSNYNAHKEEEEKNIKKQEQGVKEVVQEETALHKAVAKRKKNY